MEKHQMFIIQLSYYRISEFLFYILKKNNKLMARLDGHSFNQFIYVLRYIKIPSSTNVDHFQLQFILKFYNSCVVVFLLICCCFFFLQFRNARLSW